jgi:phage shock protein PspC (stress-responsive transcriptional regulator)
MKKTLTISISGFVFHIEEDAYEKLHRYLEAINSHFKGFDGKEEVISDVEARIAEILQKNISGSKEVITIADIEEVIAIMGQPSDFGIDEEAATGSKTASYSALPKRLYRDPERKMIGGVCSGLGAYINIDPLWVRIIFLVSIAISGFGLLVYIILWIVVPEASTTAERLEMRGEPVTVSNIERNFKDEMHDLNDRVKDFASKARSTLKKEKDEFKSRHGDNIRSGISDAGRVFLRIFLVILGVIILFIGIALSVVYLSILFKFPVVAVMDHAGMQEFPLYSVIDRIFTSDTDIRTFVTGLMILFGIPLVMMLWGGIRLIFNLPRVRFLAGLAGLAWVCALIITLIFGFKVANSFRYPGEYTREAELKIVRADTIHIVAEQHLPPDFHWEESGVFYFPEMRMALSNDEEIIRGIPLIKFRTSKDSIARIIILATAKGAFKNDAVENAEKINYSWQQKNDTLVLSDSFILPDDEKWRKQEVRVEVQLPEGTTVTIDEHLHPFLGYHKNISSHDRNGKFYLMTEEGLVRLER